MVLVRVLAAFCDHLRMKSCQLIQVRSSRSLAKAWASSAVNINRVGDLGSMFGLRFGGFLAGFRVAVGCFDVN